MRALLMLLLCIAVAHAEPLVRDVPTTYCNPVNLDYAYAFKRDAKGPNSAHRSTADPACVAYRGKYYLFSTNQEGYWWSDDLARWSFVSHLFKPNHWADQVCAPAAWATKRGVLFLPCLTEVDKMPLYLSDDPASGKWQEPLAEFPLRIWDPQFFEDVDGRLYVYWGSSNLYPLRGVELDARTYQPVGKPVDLIYLHPFKHGWEQFGENNQHGRLNPFLEGPWMSRFEGRYYLQYAAPGTEWNVYGDGVYVSDRPLGPFVYQEHNPFSWKPTGFIPGAGHGSTFADRYGNLWHVASMLIGVKHKFERRLGLFPAGVDRDGILFADTAFGDYPHVLPHMRRDPHNDFAGWMLLSYRKKCWASSSKFAADLAFDENVKTYWSANDGAPGQFLAVDLGGVKEIRALQINYAEEQAQLYGKQIGAHHRYQIFSSSDGEKWTPIVDKSRNDREVPHDYVEFTRAVKARFLKLVNVEVPTGCFAIGDFRVFGRAGGPVPKPVRGLTVRRDARDRRAMKLSWSAVPDAYAYEVQMGTTADKLYTSMLINGAAEYELHGLNVDTAYFVTVRAVGETGVSPAAACVEAP